MTSSLYLCSTPAARLPRALEGQLSDALSGGPTRDLVKRQGPTLAHRAARTLIEYGPEVMAATRLGAPNMWRYIER